MTDRRVSPIFVRTYDLLQWLVPQTLGFPRSQRGVMARRVQGQAFGLYEALVDAARCDQPLVDLRRADAALAKLRAYLRLCLDLKLLSIGQYEHAVGMTAEIGRLLGAWLKKEQHKHAARSPQEGR